MSEEYKQELLAALRDIQEVLDSGRTTIVAHQLNSLIKHVERYDTGANNGQ
jgi:hypothetical protein